MKGLIIHAYGRFYTVRGEGHEIDAVLRGRIKKEGAPGNFSAPIAVGDEVEFELNENGGGGVINSIYPRKNYFSRRDRVLAKDDIIAANLDLIVAVQSYREPRLNLRYVDRLVVRALSHAIPAAIVINKADLADDDEVRHVEDYYAPTGIQVFSASAGKGHGIEPFRDLITGKRVLFTGSSGVGKTTLLNRLFPDVSFKTSEISQSTGKGRHTTTNVKLVRSAQGTEIIDTPGMREFGLADIEPGELARFFPDFVAYMHDCRFTPCFHDREPTCGIIQAVADGHILQERHQSYLNILATLRREWETRYRSRS